MKSLKLALIAAAATAVLAPAQAQGLSYSVGVFTADTSDTRGDDFRPSLELGAAYDFGNGFYTSAGYTTGQYEGQSKDRGEMAVGVGFGKELANGLYYDVNVTRYVYPKSGENYNELGLTLGYGPVSAALYKTFDTDGFVTGTDYLDLTYSYSFTEKIGSYVTVTKSRDVSSLGVELGASYDLGNNLSASATYEKDVTPKFVLGLTKSF